MASVESNPFAALLAESQTGGVSQKLVEDVFLFTLRKDVKVGANALINMTDIIVSADESGTISEEIVGHALFERLMLTNVQDYILVSTTSTNKEDALEGRAIFYLHRAFGVCERIRVENPALAKDCEKIGDLILTNASTCIRQPDIFQRDQSLSMQWLELLRHADETFPNTQEFLAQTVLRVVADGDDIEVMGELKAIFYPLLNELQKQISQSNVVTLNTQVLSVLTYFVRDKRVPQLGEILIDYTTPNPNAAGGDYVDTLLGQLLRLTLLSKNASGQYEFFENVIVDGNYLDARLGTVMSMHQDSVFMLIKELLKLSGETKKKMLQWIGNCLQANKGRGHLWTHLNHSLEQMMNRDAGDSFMIGLAAILFRLSEPLCNPQLKVLLVDPTYCAVPEEDRPTKLVSMIKATEETCLLSADENEKRVAAEKFNFVTELFYMTHKAFELGYRSVIEKFTRITRELLNLQTAYRDVRNANPNSDLASNLMRMQEQKLQEYLCVRHGLMEPKNDELSVKFFEASAIWLTEISLISKDEYNQQLAKLDFAPKSRRNRELPTALDFVPSYLKSVPEMVIDNIVAYLSFSRYFPPGQFIENYQSSHDAFFKMIILFMGNADFVKNPHLRAKLAEALEFLLPKNIADSQRISFSTHIFDNHEDRLKVVRSLLNVFVSIEMTGQSVQFEQKFNYRRPMYAIMEYLWTIDEQVQCFKDLAKEAEENMEAINPPLFLRFINLLINDAIFLLDESLSNLQQIRQLQDLQDTDEWSSMPQNEREQHQSNLHHLGMLARFDNILGRDTINILKLLTTEIKSIFCHKTMVDRIAAMLNYFLLNLVGPQKNRLRVKDKKEFEFDPAATVLEICHIYINLSGSELFCLAVSQDGRSYSAELFSYTHNILIRIGGGQLIGDIIDFDEKVKKIDAQYKADQEFLADAPDEYLDPIMSTLMTDPVILPSSNVTVDRSTIARHLLSDQTDPFNRAPLTMDKVKPNEELKMEIEKWIAEKRAAGHAES